MTWNFWVQIGYILPISQKKSIMWSCTSTWEAIVIRFGDHNRITTIEIKQPVICLSMCVILKICIYYVMYNTKIKSNENSIWIINYLKKSGIVWYYHNPWIKKPLHLILPKRGRVINICKNCVPRYLFLDLKHEITYFVKIMPPPPKLIPRLLLLEECSTVPYLNSAQIVFLPL